LKDERVYLLHIRDAIDRVLNYTADGREIFLGDPMLQDAVLRNLGRQRLAPAANFVAPI